MMEKILRILLVEDNPGDAFLLEEMLEKVPDLSFDITVAETLEKAVKKLRKLEFNIVLLDLGLPDSVELMALETMLDLHLSFPVVVITGLNDSRTGRKAVEMGAQSYMIKGQFSSFSISQTILYSIERFKFLKRLKDNEAELKKKNSMLTESNAAKNLLISIVSHDLRGPLNSIVSLLEIVYDKFETIDNDTKRKYLNSILKSATNSRNLMENLLDWANINANRRKVEPEKLDVSQLMLLGTEPLQQIAENKEIEIQLENNVSTTVFADPRMITTVIRNLVSNALKFTPRNGTIKLFTTYSGNGQVYFHVQDSGVGIEKETLNTLFDLGKTISSKGTENEEGTGFGLILCKEFVEKNNGKIDIQSQKGKGTTVRFSLPLAT